MECGKYIGRTKNKEREAWETKVNRRVRVNHQRRHTHLQWLFAFSNYALFPPHPSQMPGSNPQSQSIQVWLDSGPKCSLSLCCPLHLFVAVKPPVWYDSKVEAAHLVSPFLTFALNRKMQPSSLAYGTHVPIPRPSHSPINQLLRVLCSQLGVGKRCLFKRKPTYSYKVIGERAIKWEKKKVHYQEFHCTGFPAQLANCQCPKHTLIF